MQVAVSTSARRIGLLRMLKLRIALLALSVAAACSSSGADATTSPDGTQPPTGGSLSRRVFPADNAWNRDVSADPVDPNSATLMAACGVRNLHPDFGSVYGIPYILVGGAETRRPVTFDYADESDPGPYPIPPNAPIEGGASSSGDRHVRSTGRPPMQRAFRSFRDSCVTTKR
jgi:hypothetical protein